MFDTKQSEPLMLRKMAWLCHKFLSKARTIGEQFSLSYELIAQDMSERLGIPIKERAVRWYCLKLKQLGLLSTKQVMRKKLAFTILNIEGLKELKLKIEEEIHKLKPKHIQNLAANQNNHSANHETLAANQNNLAADSYLKSSLKSPLKSSLQQEAIDSVDKILEEATQAVETVYGAPEIGLVKEVEGRMKQAASKSSIRNLKSYALKTAESLKGVAQHYLNPMPQPAYYQKTSPILKTIEIGNVHLKMIKDLISHEMRT